jgi:starch synthase
MRNINNPMHTLSPASDTAIAHRYSAKNLEVKIQNKTALQEELGWPAEPKRAMLCVPAGISEALGGELFTETIQGLLSLPIELVIFGKGSSSYGALCTELAAANPHRVAIVKSTEENQRKMLAAADMALFFTDANGLPELQAALQYGAVPVAPETPALTNYNPNQESGNAFLYEEKTSWLCFAAVVRALETYRFPFDWRTIQKHGMTRND